MNLPASIAVLFALGFQATPPPPAIPATFDGVFRGVESGRVVVEVENGQSMRMFVTGSTKFIRGGKPSKAAAFSDGDAVTVDAVRDARMNLVALRVEAVPPRAPKPAGDTEKRN
jgi:hypothetical protein